MIVRFNTNIIIINMFYKYIYIYQLIYIYLIYNKIYLLLNCLIKSNNPFILYIYIYIYIIFIIIIIV